MTKPTSASSGNILIIIIPTSRNIPVRNLYRDNGFTEDEPGLWECRPGASIGPQSEARAAV
jgi:hypothetical protein